MSTTDGSVRVPRNAHDSKQHAAPKPPSPYFPQGYKDAACQWWTNVTPHMAERRILNFIPQLKEAADSLGNPSSAVDRSYPVGTRVWRRTMVQLSGKNRAINEVSVERVGEKEDETLVMLHGYGAGLGFYYKNLEPISRVRGLKLYALDMLGMGNSSRPSFKIRAKSREEQVVEAENWFVDALEEWRLARKIERFTLLGHSLGGYLAVSYALKYPGHLKKLILASPVGIPKDPYAVNASMPEPSESTLEHEFTQDQQAIVEQASRMRNTNPASSSSSSLSASSNKSSTDAAAVAEAPGVPKRPIPQWLVWLWDANVSPFSIVRMSGPIGPRLVSGWSSRRFSHLPPEEADALHEYSFSIFKQKGSGEYALAYILAPGAYARRPVIDRIQGVGRQVIKRRGGGSGDTVLRETGIPVVFMYGESDWMDPAGGLAAEEKLNHARAKALQHGTPEERRRENGSARVVMVPNAGHNLFLDNPDDFNDVIRREMEKTIAEEKAKRRNA